MESGARAPATLCAVSELRPDRKQLVFTAFDPIHGRTRELARFPTEPTAQDAEDLASDGNRIAMVRRFGKGAIAVLSFASGTMQEISTKDLSSIESIAWAADGRSVVTLHVRRRSILLNVDLKGNARELWSEEGGTGLQALPSADGRQLALYARAISQNVWMMEGF